MKIILNADDFGYCNGVNLGIIESFKCGIVRSTSMLAAMPGFDHAVRLAAQYPGLGIGVHLTLSVGKSVGGAYATITDRDGYFLPIKEIERRAARMEIDLSEVETEFEFQIRKIQAARIVPDHFDSHHHIHRLPGIEKVFLNLAKKFGVAVRSYSKEALTGEYAGIRTTDDFDDTFYNGNISEKHLKEIIERYDGTSLEIMCHPAYLDQRLLENSSYSMKRIFELKELTNPAMKVFIKEKGHELCSFGEIGNRR